MTNINYSPDEIRLLDEFAKAAVTSLVVEELSYEAGAQTAYTQAAAMIAERRKRVSRIDPMDELRAEMSELEPQPEQQPEGELTEEAIAFWAGSAKNAQRGGFYQVDISEIDRAVALMREGLAAKSHHANALQMLAHNIEARKKLDEENRTLHDERTDARVAQSLAEKERDDARAAAECHSANHDTVLTEIEKLRAQLAVAQPVLDAVVTYWCSDGSLHRSAADVLKVYADRRNEAKQQGGAS